MPKPDGGLIRENNFQYYAGAQILYTSVAATTIYDFTFNTKLVLGSTTSYATTDPDYTLNNFQIYTSPNGISNWTEYTTAYTITYIEQGYRTTSRVTLGAGQGIGTYVKVQLKEGAVENNYGGYEYIKLREIINNFIVGYVGQDKLIPRVNRTDVIFHAKRGLQEFSYDTLKSIKSQELTVPDSLSLVIPQDYVNYVALSWIDQYGVKRPLFPNNNLTTNPYTKLLQDDKGIPTQDNFGEDLEGTSLTVERWRDVNPNRILNEEALYDQDLWAYGYYANDFGSGPWNWGRLYGLDPQYSNANGWFGINERDGKFTFSSNLRDKLIVLEYISDGLAYDLDTRIPKLAEEAMYMSISYNLLAGRAGVPEGLVARFKKDRRAALRNAKIRLSNIKLDQIVQVMRGKSKWIKH